MSQVIAVQSHEKNESRLDSLGLKALETMQQIVSLKLQLQDHVKTGSINLAKSRYIMGNRSVSSTQLPTEDSSPFNALCKIEHSKGIPDGETSFFTLHVDECQKKKTQNKNEDQSNCRNDSDLSCDPLNWFGVLVPQNLRCAQNSFRKAIELSVKIANLQVYLETIRIDFCTLKLAQIKLS